MSLKTISQVFKRSVKIFNFNGLGKLCGVSHHQRMTGFCFYIYADRERESVLNGRCLTFYTEFSIVMEVNNVSETCPYHNLAHKYRD